MGRDRHEGGGVNVVAIRDPATARNRADRIREGLEELKPLILAAWEARDWEVLGYSSWQEYVVGEYGGQLRLGRTERQEAVKELHDVGMSTRAIGSVLGVHHGTVARDVANATTEPTPITGLDGKTYQPPPPRQEESIEYSTAAWVDLAGLMETIERTLERDAADLAAAVPSRRRAATARRLRKLGTGLGRIAWTLEGMEETQ
jgi:hypothetical protein